MSDENAASKAALREEADGAVAGPGVVATKSQTKGSLLGTVLGTGIGAVLGVLVGGLFFSGTRAVFVIAVIAFALAGATAGATAGGFLFNREQMERGEPDV